MGKKEKPSKGQNFASQRVEGYAVEIEHRPKGAIAKRDSERCLELVGSTITRLDATRLVGSNRRVKP